MFLNWDVGDKSSGHGVVLAAYDPTQVDTQGESTPWGILNWWDENPGGITWMAEDTFEERFNTPYLTRGKNNMVVVTANQ